VVVHGQGDAYVDSERPLVLELSADGTTFEEAARRTTPIAAADPWVVRLKDASARWLRVRKPARGDLTLCEIEVFE
jgi:hypothetical protein